MENIGLMAYQGTIRRAVLSAFADTNLLPLDTAAFIEISFTTREELDIVAATKPILDALKGSVYADDAAVRTLTVRIDPNTTPLRRGPEGEIVISIGEEQSIPGEQPHKTLAFLPVSLKINTSIRQDEPPHSMKGEPVDNNSEMEQLADKIRNTLDYEQITPLGGDLMVSVKIRARERTLDIDNILKLYLGALLGICFSNLSQLKFVHVTFMDVEVFDAEEGLYLTFAPYNPRDWE